MSSTNELENVYWHCVATKRVPGHNRMKHNCQIQFVHEK